MTEIKKAFVQEKKFNGHGELKLKSPTGFCFKENVTKHDTNTKRPNTF